MQIVPVLGIGALRIFQSSINKQTSKYMTEKSLYVRYGFYFEALAGICSLFYLFLAGLNGFNLPTLLCAMLTGACFFVEFSTSLKAMRSAPLALCTLCSLGGGIIIPAIIGIFYFNEPLSIWQWLGVLLFFISAYFLMPSESKKMQIQPKALAVLLINFLVNGACGFIGKYFAVKIPSGNVAMFSFLSYAFASIFFGLLVLIQFYQSKCESNEKLQEPQAPFPKPLYLWGIAVGAVCATIVYFSTVFSRTIPIVILNTIPNAMCMIGSLIIGVCLFHEKLTLKKCLGILLSALSTTIIILL